MSSKSKKRLVRVEVKEDVKEEIYKLFDIPSWALRLQMFLDSFGEYADVDNTEELPASCKLLAVDIRDESETCAAAKMVNLPR